MQGNTSQATSLSGGYAGLRVQQGARVSVCNAIMAAESS